MSSSHVDDRGFLGYKVLTELNQDAWLLIITKAIRLYSYGDLAVMLVIYLQHLQFTNDNIGLLFTLTLFGDAFISIFLTTHADHVFGRRNTLLIGSFIAIVTSFIFTFTTNFYIMLIAGILGVISPSGNEIGPFMAIELSDLSEVSADHQRTHLMAWYNLFGSIFSAFGALTCGYSMSILLNIGYSWIITCRYMLVLYTCIQIIQFLIFTFISTNIETTLIKTSLLTTRKSSSTNFLGLHKSTTIVIQLSILFMIDAFAGSFILQSIQSAWFDNTVYIIHHHIN